MSKSKKTTNAKATKSKTTTAKASSKSAKSRKRAKVDDVQIAEATILEQAPDTAAAPPNTDAMPAEVEAAAPTKSGKAKKNAGEPKAKKPSGLDAAYEVLKANGGPMTCKAIVDEMLAKGMWTTNGRTPAATIYSAMLREIDNKPGESRFTKTGRGLFAAAA
ncbi:MAG: winged helix-turn-helix domain-containing protein [Phycisphaerales bacterium]|nr:winged helix-turn-helix domain-containing protein [Phycisphaerales bacterium]